ncbi:MAG TPA: aromatic ring-hydroxylating dioxygenase subunit alpha [Planctomycetaceae bacterium]|jgi:phenylpropionate dioxygenase-like ring-hydroxylating dioxygenase large terminal subunit|nr:aromatic ring-hydroxylating dioxygenase subunit alpha [Planctomycetaceae bacterium]
MFQLQGKLDHLLPPAAYHAADWHERELEDLFRASWQLACLAEQVKKPGSRFALRIAGEPVVIVNQNGTVSALGNVCAHRHSQIVPDGPSQDSRFRCQVHGWEYDETGRLSHLPDGRSFRGLKAHDLCLSRYRVEQCGPFVFVNLSPEGPSFQEYLGSFAEEFQQFFAHCRHIDTWVTEHPVNWKIIVENAVESYHVPMVHPTTFEDYRAEELHDHRLEPSFTRYADMMEYRSEKSAEAYLFRFYSWFLLRNPTYQRFTHVHLFPNMLLYFGDIYSAFKVIEPLGATRSRYTMYSFAPDAIHWGPLGRMLQSLSMRVLVPKLKTILQEDMARWPPVQQGLEKSRHKGVLSAREERVYAFQDYVVKKLRATPDHLQV